MKGRKSSDFLKGWPDLKGDPIFYLFQLRKLMVFSIVDLGDLQ